MCKRKNGDKNNNKEVNLYINTILLTVSICSIFINYSYSLYILVGELKTIFKKLDDVIKGKKAILNILLIY